MAIGIIEPKTTSWPHGTVLLADLEDRAHQIEVGTGKKLKMAPGGIVLVPQPSDDKNDPLNWNIYYRDSITLCLMFSIMTFAGGIGPILTAFMADLTVLFGVSFSKVSMLTGWNLLTVAVNGFIISPVAKRYGKRPVMMTSALFGMVGSIICIYATSYNSMVAGRVVQGFSVSANEALGFSIVADLYCVHQRGTRVAAMLIPMSAINILCPLISGVVAEREGIKAVFQIMSVFSGVALLLITLGIPETTYHRKETQNSDNAVSNDVDEKVEKPGVEFSETVEESPESLIPKKTYLQRLKPYNGVFDRANPLLLIAKMIYLLMNPAVVWSCITQGAVAAWTVAVSLLLSQIFSAPPYNMTSAQVGYLYGGACVGGFLAEVACISFNDRLMTRLARLNNGVYEPEFRLVFIFLMIIFGSVGFFGFGYSCARNWGPVTTSAFYGFITASLIFAQVTSGSYVNDGYRDISVEAFVDVMIFKNLIFFLFSFYVNAWITNDGPVKVFNTIGGIQIAVGALSLPLYVFGKVIRAWWYGTMLQTPVAKKLETV